MSKKTSSEMIDRSQAIMLDQVVDNCTFTKTILMVIVVVYHCIVFWGGDWFSAKSPTKIIPSVNVLAKWLNSFHVYGFALTSGYLYSFLRFEKGRYQRLGSFLVTKAKRLLIPYVFISIVWVIPIGQVFFHESTKNIFMEYFFGTGPSQLWFLLMLFGVFAIAWPLSNKIHSSFFLSIAIAGSIYIVGLVGAHFIDNYYMIWTSCLFLFIFIVGMKMRDLHLAGLFLDNKARTSIVLFILDILVFAVWWVVNKQEGIAFTILNIPIELLLHLTGAIMVFYALQSFAERFDWKSNNLLMSFTRISMIVYLLHQQLVYLSIAIVDGNLSPFTNMAINFTAAIGGSYLLAKMLTTNRLTRFLVGEK